MDMDGSGIQYLPGFGEAYPSEGLDEDHVVSSGAGSGWVIFSTQCGKAFLIFSYE
jgi:hypothetical protein